jgi:hypothetical protein
MILSNLLPKLACTNSKKTKRGLTLSSLMNSKLNNWVSNPILKKNLQSSKDWCATLSTDLYRFNRSACTAQVHRKLTGKNLVISLEEFSVTANCTLSSITKLLKLSEAVFLVWDTILLKGRSIDFSGNASNTKSWTQYWKIQLQVWRLKITASLLFISKPRSRTIADTWLG